MTYVPVVMTNGSLNVYAVLEGRTPTLEWLQGQVGGNIEVVGTCISGLKMVVNEEGRISGLGVNDTATDLSREHLLVGNAVVLRQLGSELMPLCAEELSYVARFCASSRIETRRAELEDEDEEEEA